MRLAAALLPWLALCACGVSPPSDTLDVCDTLELFTGPARAGLLVQHIGRDSSGKAVVARTELSASLALAQGEPAQDIVLEETRTYAAASGMLVHAQMRLRSPSGESRWELAPRGSRWTLTVSAGGSSSSRDVGNVRERVGADVAVREALRSGRLLPGQVWEDTAFDLASATFMASRTVCTAVPAAGNGWCAEFRVHDLFAGREDRLVLDRTGRTLLRTVAPVFTGRARGYAGGDSLPSGPLSLSKLLSVPAPRPAAEGEQVVVLVDSGSALHASVRGFYRADGRGQVVLAAVRCSAGVQAVVRAAGDTAPTPTMQSADRRIREQAAQVVTGSDVCAMVSSATTWVYRSIRKRNTATFSSALETLRCGYGDCGEHAVLLGALLRSRGVPAHVVVGLVYIAADKAYAGHAWVAISTNRGWLLADPVMGRFPAGPGLVPLVVDDQGDRGVYALNLVGRLRIEYRPR